jgi:hypothetical protein
MSGSAYQFANTMSVKLVYYENVSQSTLILDNLTRGVHAGDNYSPLLYKKQSISQPTATICRVGGSAEKSFPPTTSTTAGPPTFITPNNFNSLRLITLA